MKKTILAFVLLPILAFAQFPGVNSYNIETTLYKPTDLILRRGESKTLEFIFLQTNAPMTLASNVAVRMNYKPIGQTSGYYIATGTLYSAAGGVVRIAWDSGLNPANKVSDYDLTVSTSNAVLCRAFGRLTMDSQVSVGVATNGAGLVTLIDWATVQNQNTGSAPFGSGGGGGTGAVSSVTNGTGLSVSPASGVGAVTLALSTATTASLARADSALQSYTETDPKWSAVSNAVIAGAALGSTALQAYNETDPVYGAVSSSVQAHTESEHNLTTFGGFRGGTGSFADYGGAIGISASATRGFAGGESSMSDQGGAVGYGAYSDQGGAVGYDATAGRGGAAGWNASAVDGGASGYGASATNGGAVGYDAKTSDGFAGGKYAVATVDGTTEADGIDAIQLGQGTNTAVRTMKVYGFELMASNGIIPDERINAGMMTNNGGPYTISITDATATNQPVTLAQAEALSLSSVEFLLSTNRVTAVTNFQADTTTVYRLELPDGMVNGTASVTYAKINQYPIGWVFTNQTFTSFGGGVGNVTLWNRENGPGSASHKPEFYFVSVDGSNYYEFAETAIAQVVPAGSAFVKQEWDVSYMATTLPKVCYGAIRMKVTAVSGTPTVEYGVGQTWVSHLVLSIPQSVILAPVYAAIAAVTNGTITNATYAAQDGITISGQTLNLGTNLFGGGTGGSSTPTNWSQYPAGSTVLIGTNYISNTGTGGVWISEKGRVTMGANTNVDYAYVETNGVFTFARGSKRVQLNPNFSGANNYGQIGAVVADAIDIRLSAGSGYVHVSSNGLSGVNCATPTKALEVTGDLRLTSPTNQIWAGTNAYMFWDTTTAGWVTVIP